MPIYPCWQKRKNANTNTNILTYIFVNTTVYQPFCTSPPPDVEVQYKTLKSASLALDTVTDRIDAVISYSRGSYGRRVKPGTDQIPAVTNTTSSSSRRVKRVKRGTIVFVSCTKFTADVSAVTALIEVIRDGVRGKSQFGLSFSSNPP